MPAETLAAAIFVLTTGGVVAGIIVAVRRAGADTAARRRDGTITTALLLAWLGATAGLAAAGIFADLTSFPPRVMPVVLAGNIAAIAVACSALGRRLALDLPLAWLVGIHVFRVGVELCLALLYHAQVVPVQMTFEGRNWDILVGLSALPMAWLASRGRLRPGLLLLWTLAGLGLLLNIVAISVLSLPTSFRAFPGGPANTIIAGAPYIWLPALLVPIALGAHLVAIRRLLLSRAGQATPAIGRAPREL